MSVPDHENHTSADQTHPLCDFCDESKAVLYCRADSAKLCLSCDREVHSTNQLFKKHNRSLLCDSCNSSPSSIFCCTESAVLCQNCDWETHKNYGSVHNRRPIEGFNGCPSLCELLNFLGLEDLGKKKLDYEDEGLLDMLVWETPNVVSLDDLIVPNDCNDSGRSFQAMGVPPLPKNRNAACGKHKEEILGQLREMAKTEPNFTGTLEDLEPDVQFQSQVPPGKCQLRDSSPGLKNNAEPTSVPSYETSAFKWCDFTGGGSDEGFPSTFADSFIDLNHLVPEKDSDVGESTGFANGFQEVQSCVPVDSKTVQQLPNPGTLQMIVLKNSYDSTYMVVLLIRDSHEIPDFKSRGNLNYS
ncbi:hypothetical protein BUALT_Bualt02G0229100 [Buddleja alternifolia]|uniref:B box-type domain-containing protein n=1 Tax=Buddleja alternifolia TaxID=168488 RepID=A0AAV6Y9M0_9LAMI|nr:hypothetical protein BUALT_Bualt02G0229100 [Buddleja alternifolia]